MDAGPNYWKDWVGFWGYVSGSAMERWQKAAQRLQKEDYKVESFFSDVVGFWSNTAMASVAAWQGSMRTPQPVIFCLEQQDEFAGPQFVSIFAPSLPYKQPSFVWLKCLDTPEPPHEHRIDWDNLCVQFTTDRTQLEIKLKNLRTPLAPATYRAMVHVDEVPIAEVFIVVREPKMWSGVTAQRQKPKTERKSKT